jgi:hypothetical protein
LNPQTKLQACYRIHGIGRLVAFAKAANEQLAAQIPDIGIDNLLVISVHGRVVVYAYRAGCQVGFVVLRAMPKLGE